MRIWFDTEFIEDGHTIDLLSIGLVREDGETYYAEPQEADRSRASEWVQENVLPTLTGPTKPRAQIAADIVEFVGDAPEFWAWYADYDWVALCQLFGTMMDLPDGWPYYCRDFKQVCDERGLDVSQDDSDHNALGDARWLARTMQEKPMSADTPVSPKVAAGTVAAAVTTLVMYLLSLVPFVAAMPAAAQGALLVVVTAAVTYGAGYATRDALRAVPRHRTRVADPGPEAGAISSDMVLAVFIGAFLAGVALWVLGELVGRM